MLFSHPILRVDLQRAFFPPAFQNAEEAVPRNPGEERAFSAFRILVEVYDDFTIQLPTREASKVSITPLHWSPDGSSDCVRTGNGMARAVRYLSVENGYRPF
jgi:hypothetical protein